MVCCTDGVLHGLGALVYLGRHGQRMGKRTAREASPSKALPASGGVCDFHAEDVEAQPCSSHALALPCFVTSTSTELLSVWQLKNGSL